jgi:hypothetical protein
VSARAWFGVVVAVALAGPCAEVRAQAPPPPSPRAVALFDGRTLSGWEGDAKVWRVEGGAITGGSRTTPTDDNTFLASTREFTNFVLRLRIRLTGHDGFINSGIQIRSRRVAGSAEMIGYQCDLGDPDYWGEIYDESRRDRILAPSAMAAIEPSLHRNDWNAYVIRADGPRITTWLNGVRAADYTETNATIPLTGKLGIQIHGGGTTLVQVKDVTIDILPGPR